MSKAEMLLLAGYDLTLNGRDEFGIEDLVVAAHRRFGAEFALKGYPQHPDSNSVFTQVMGKKARVIVNGWLEKTGTKKYKITAKGLYDAERLRGEDASVQVTTQLARGTEEGLGRLFTSQAYELFANGKGDEITFHQFSRFAELSARDKWQRVQGKLSTIDHLASEARRLGEAGETIRMHFRGTNYTFNPQELRSLEALVSFLSAKFRAEMLEWERNATGS